MNGDAARRYHDDTKHSPESVRTTGHYLDWPNQPRPYKLYRDLPALALPPVSDSSASALQAIANLWSQTRPGPFDLNVLASLLRYSNGVTRRLRFDGGLMEFRAAACTGALYHIELYVVCADLPGLGAGVYQFDAHDEALRPLRAGDFRKTLAAATADEDAVSHAPAVLLCTSTFWRNSWKYQDRTYRHCFWDAGTVIANLLGLANAHGLPASVITGFVDGDVNELLDLDDEREVTLALIPVGRLPEPASGPLPPVSKLDLATVPYSSSEIDYSAIHRIHAASSLEDAASVALWRSSVSATTGSATGSVGGEDSAAAAAGPSLERVIRHRGSARAFVEAGISSEQLITILDTACAPVSADYRASAGALSDPFLIVRAVEGLAPGAYVWRRGSRSLEVIAEGDFSEDAWHLDLGQVLAAQAAVDIYFLSDLGPILDELGDRGYRAAQLDAAIEAGRAYLAAYALGLGATGLTFYDDDVISFFGPPAAGRSVMFLIAIGVPARRR